MNKRLALLIGNTEFDSVEDFSVLRTPTNDVQDFADVLQNYGDFEIVGTLLDEDAQTIKYAIEGLYSQAQRGDLTLLYYSGHGFKVKGGKLFLAAKNTWKERPVSTGIQESFIRDVMSLSSSRHRVTILDCCFSGAFISGQKSGDDALLFEELKGEATAILASSSKIQYSFEEKGRNSLFTLHLIKGIKTGKADEDKDGKITIKELFNYVERRVRDSRPEQTPMIELSEREGEIIIARGIEFLSEKIFISHANPEDNYFAAWLASKLNLMGYDVWCDVEELKGGEDYWKYIEQTILNKSAKFLFVTTETSVKKDGALKELAIANQISNRGDFVIPLNIDEVPFSKFPPGIIKLNAIDFSKNWAVGLKQLTEKLEKDKIPNPQISNPEHILDFWKQSLSIKNDTYRP